MTHYEPGAQQQKIANYLGLAQKAGKIMAGDAAALSALKARHAKLLVLARDTADETARQLRALAAAQELPLLYWPDKLSLGLIVGKSRRGALALTDAGFTAAILKQAVAQQDNDDEQSS